MSNIIHLEDELLQIKGATKVVSSTPTQAVIEMGGKSIILTGSNLEVKKLNLEENEVVLSGNFAMIKLGDANAKKGSLLKRILK